MVAWWWLLVVWVLTTWATVLVLALCRAASDPLLETMEAINERREGR